MDTVEYATGWKIGLFLKVAQIKSVLCALRQTEKENSGFYSGYKGKKEWNI